MKEKWRKYLKWWCKKYMSNWWEWGGVPDPWAIYEARGAASLAASYVDLSGNGNDATPAVAPDWDNINGWSFDGLSYLTTTFTTAGPSQSIVVWYTDAAVDAFLFGAFTGANMNTIQITSTNVWYANAGEPAKIAPTIASGVIGFAGNRAYRNAVQEDGILGDAGITGFQPWHIGGVNFNGTPIPSASKQRAVAIYDTVLTSSEMAIVMSSILSVGALSIGPRTLTAETERPRIMSATGATED